MSTYLRAPRRENGIRYDDYLFASVRLRQKFVCGKEIGEILYGTHEYCNICDASSREFTGTYHCGSGNGNGGGGGGNRGKRREHVGYGSV